MSQETEALQRASKYSLIPNKLGYCGPPESWPKLMGFIAKPRPEQAPEIERTLQRFYALYPYLELIAKANDAQPFDAGVIEAYWLGNKLLRSVQYSEMQKTILSFQLHGLPREIAERKAAALPDCLLPHHSFHVLYVNFITKKVQPIVENLSNCLVQWAEVKEETKAGIKVKGVELFLEGSSLKLREKAKTLQNPYCLALSAGDIVSVHWGNAVEKLSSTSLNCLKKQTIGNLAILEAAGFNGKK
ncbi:MAG: DUF6390 family protein [Candidatus Diapherotrites archaeon]|nr:DUF6390 family protein [Candidatus Diapherotrites archaeon]